MFKAREFDMGFLGGKFLVQGFCWVLLEALGILGAFDFFPHSIIQSGVSPSPRPPSSTLLRWIPCKAFVP